MGEIPLPRVPETVFANVGGGETGIRTLETVSRLHTFQACAFDHSATSPCRAIYPGLRRGDKSATQKTRATQGQTRFVQPIGET